MLLEEPVQRVPAAHERLDRDAVDDERGEDLALTDGELRLYRVAEGGAQASCRRLASQSGPRVA